MLTNGLYIEGKENVTIGSGHDVCDVCERVEACKPENIGKSPTEIRRIVSRQSNNKLMKVIPWLKNRDGQPATICHDCLKKFAEETESIS